MAGSSRLKVKLSSVRRFASQQIEGLGWASALSPPAGSGQRSVTTSGGSNSHRWVGAILFLLFRIIGTWLRSCPSGREKRLYLLKLLRKPNVLFSLDEPTNDLDIATFDSLGKISLWLLRVLSLTVSHDRYFLDKVATKSPAFEDGKIRPFFWSLHRLPWRKAFWNRDG